MQRVAPAGGMEQRISSGFREMERDIDAKDQGKPLSHFGYSMPVGETVLLGNVAYRSGHKLEWNAEQFTIDNAHEAEEFLQRDYRPGWTL